MLPVLFTINKFNVYAFGLFLGIAFILSTFIVWFFSKDEFKEEDYLDAFLYTCVAALVSSRAVYIARHIDEFRLNILKYILVRETPGLSLLGGFIGGFLFLWLYTKKKKLSFIHLLDLFSLAGSFALILTKIGEQLSGAGFGRETDFFLKIRIVGLSNFHHPTELYEAIAYFIISLMLLFIYKKSQRNKWPHGTTFYVFAFLIGLTIFSLEFLKVFRVYLYGLSLRHILSLLIMLVVFIPLVKNIKSIIRPEKKVQI